MSVLFGDRKRVTVVGVIGLAVAVVWLLVFSVPLRVHAAAPSGFYQQKKLVSDLPGAVIQDSNLVNSWGIAFSATSPFWVANNVTGTSTLYSGDVNSPLVKVPMVVTIPGGGAPTGVVFNGTADFVVHSGAASGPARFIFASQTGVISGWNSMVPPPAPSTNAQIGATADAVYTGLAIGQSGGANYLYAADLEHNTIDVYDKTFQHVELDGSFSDPNVPNSYSVFNIQNLGGKLYVTYAQQSHKEPDEETDRGSGFVDVFDTSGHLLQRLIKGNHLNAPWGLALAPGNFGPFSNALIVGNFGNGHLQAFDPDSGRFLGELNAADRKPIVIDGLWGLIFGNGGSGGDRNTLYFASGPEGETHGLFGSLRFVEGS
jgi:uncharacterized protein (TIGR03118 family)